MNTETTVVIRNTHLETDDLLDGAQTYGDAELGELLWDAARIVDSAEGNCDRGMAKRLRLAARQFLG